MLYLTDVFIEISIIVTIKIELVSFADFVIPLLFLYSCVSNVCTPMAQDKTLAIP